MPKMKREKQEAAKTMLSIRLLRGGVLAAVFAVSAVAVVALLVSGGLLSRTIADKSVVVACVLGVLVGALYVLKCCGRGFLLVGVGVGAVEWLFLLIVGAICFGGFAGVGEMAGTVVGCLGGGLLAGMLHALRGGSRKRKG